jgi:hypothetical protein
LNTKLEIINIKNIINKLRLVNLSMKNVKIKITGDTARKYIHIVKLLAGLASTNAPRTQKMIVIKTTIDLNKETS